MLDKIRIVHIPYDYIDKHSYDEWKAMTFHEMMQNPYAEVYTPQDFQAAFNFDEISDLSYIFFYEIQ